MTARRQASTRATGPCKRDMRLTKLLLRQFYEGNGRTYGAKVQGEHPIPWGVKTPMGDFLIYNRSIFDL